MRVYERGVYERLGGEERVAEGVLLEGVRVSRRDGGCERGVVEGGERMGVRYLKSSGVRARVIYTDTARGVTTCGERFRIRPFLRVGLE